MGAIVKFVVEHPELLAATVVSVLGIAYLYWPSDPFDIKEGAEERLIKGK